jgi:GT2 family glycosyltransferase
MTLCSIVIPVHNKAALTRDCVRALLAEPPDVAHEIIVVDDASNDRTAGVLRDFGESIHVVWRRSNGGFATACNDGAAAARGDRLVFLNNDTLPLPGWLDRLVAYSEQHEAVVTGAKLLFPNGSVQHAGVVVCSDGKPRHIYAGFPADHPAVNKSRRFQAVTAACALIRRAPFEEVGGFDSAFRNCLEDTDLCLRLGERGHQVHFCHESTLYHLESVSRGRRSNEIERNARLFRERWGGRVRPDELSYYVEDGLLDIGYRDAYPIRLEVAPELATVTVDSDREQSALDRSSAQVLDLLKETIRLSSHIAELELPTGPRDASVPRGTAVDRWPRPETREEILHRARELEAELAGLQTRLASAVSRTGEGVTFAPSAYLGYRRVIEDVQASVADTVPPDASVLVLSRGDEELLELGGRQAWHFPQQADGRYLGHYPADGAAAIRHLEELRARGAAYLLVPSTAYWWLDHYSDFGRHLRERYSAAEGRREACVIFSLAGR